MKPKLILCLALVLSGGLFAGCETDRMPSQTGTWIGIAEPYTLYTADGIPHQALQFIIQEGPKMWGEGFDKGSFHESAATNDAERGQFFVARTVVVEKKYDAFHGVFAYYSVEPKLYEGRRLKIRGDIELVADVFDPNDKSLLIRTTPKLDYEHMGLGVIRAKRIEIIDSTNTPSSRNHEP